MRTAMSVHKAFETYMEGMARVGTERAQPRNPDARRRQ